MPRRIWRGSSAGNQLSDQPSSFDLVALVMERMKNTGMDIRRADAAKLAQQSSQALLQRLHNGGENMPSFSHLSETEVRSLVAYLKQLAGVPGAEQEQSTSKRIGKSHWRTDCEIHLPHLSQRGGP